MFAREAFKLVQEVGKTEEIKPFNEALVRQVIEEVNTLYEANSKDVDAVVAGKPGVTNTLLVRHLAMSRNKQCLLTYLYHRMRRLRHARWELGSILPSELTSNLIPPELQWFNAYSKSLATYMRSIGGEGMSGMNILNDMTPPKSLYIEVRCVQDYGKLELEDGQSVTLKENTYHLLPRADCEALIRQGILEHISS